MTNSFGWQYKTIPLNGRLITAIDGSLLKDGDFQTLRNMCYGTQNPQGVKGMTKVTTNVPTTYTAFQTGIYFRKENPFESHILFQCFDSSNIASVILDMTTVPPGVQTSWGAALYAISNAWVMGVSYAVNDIVKVAPGYYAECLVAGTAGAEPTWGTTEFATVADGTMRWLVRKGDLFGKFSLAPDNSVVFADGHHVLIYSGNELRCGAFLNSSGWSAGLDPTIIMYDYSAQVSNTMFDSLNVATLKRVPSGADQNKTIAYIGFTRPVTGIKFYLKTVNTTGASTPSLYYWGASGWTAVSSFVDGTDMSLTSMATTGVMTFTDGSSTGIANCLPRIINNTMAYWYQVVWPVSALDETTETFFVTGQAPMQPITDIWDGAYRDVSQVQFWDDSKSRFEEYTTAVLKVDGVFQADAYSGITAATGLDIRGMVKTDDAIYVGFEEPQCGLNIVMFPANYLGAAKYSSCNTNTSAVAVKYWDGDSWSAVADCVDGTSKSGKCFNQSGLMSWTPKGRAYERKTTVNNGRLLYYYQITVSANLSSGTSVGIDQITGIPCPKDDLQGYIFPLMWADQLWLCGKYAGDKNIMVPSAPDTSSVFNADTCNPVYLGDNTPLRAGVSLFSRYASSAFDSCVIVKDYETWILDRGTEAGQVNKLRIAHNIGCNAPYSLVSCDLGTEAENGGQRAVAIWQSPSGIVCFDGSTISLLSDDIANFFSDKDDTTVTDRVNPTYAHLSQCGFDHEKKWLYWSFADGDSTGVLNRLMVFDVIKKGWFEIAVPTSTTGTDQNIQCFTSVWDTVGNSYTYGAAANGYLERLNYGTTFDGVEIPQEVRLAATPLMEGAEGLWKNTQITRCGLVMVSKNELTTQPITVTHYYNEANTGEEIGELQQIDTTHRITTKSVSCDTPAAITHSIGLETITDSEEVGFEPLALKVAYVVKDLDI